MKIACVYPDTPNWPKMRWVHEAFQRLGHTVRQVTCRDELQAADNECDLIVFAHKGLAIRWPNMRDIASTRKATWCQWYFDLNALGHRLSFDPMTLQKMCGMDVVFVKERLLLNEYKELGVNAVYLDQGCPSHLAEVDYGAKKDLDVLLWGQGAPNYKQRVRDACLLAEFGLNVAWAGNPQPPKNIESLPWTPPDKLPELASRARIVLSVGRRNDVDSYHSDSDWLALGMGACVLRRYFPGSEAMPVLTYCNHQELLQLASAIIKDNSSEALGKYARKVTFAYHKVEDRLNELLYIVFQSRQKRSILAECATQVSADTFRSSQPTAEELGTCRDVLKSDCSAYCLPVERDRPKRHCLDGIPLNCQLFPKSEYRKAISPYHPRSLRTILATVCKLGSLLHHIVDIRCDSDYGNVRSWFSKLCKYECQTFRVLLSVALSVLLYSNHRIEIVFAGENQRIRHEPFCIRIDTASNVFCHDSENILKLSIARSVFLLSQS